MKSLLLLLTTSIAFSIVLPSFNSNVVNAQTTSKDVLDFKARAGDQNSKSNQARLKNSAYKAAAISNERRTELMTFVKSNHPEIRPLLKMLQKSRPAKYQSTLRSLDREVRSLQNLQAKHPERYKVALEFWTVKSKISLLSARLATKKSKGEQQKIRNQLDVLIKKRIEIRKTEVQANIVRTTNQIERLKSQLERLNSQLGQVSGESDQVVQLEMERIDAAAKRLREARQKSRENAKKKRLQQNQKDQESKTPKTKDPASKDAN